MRFGQDVCSAEQRSDPAEVLLRDQRGHACVQGLHTVVLPIRLVDDLAEGPPGPVVVREEDLERGLDRQAVRQRFIDEFDCYILLVYKAEETLEAVPSYVVHAQVGDGEDVE